MPALDTTLEIETPEHIVFRYQLAGPARRAAAYLIDLSIRAIVLLVIAVVFLGMNPENSDIFSGYETGLLLVIFFVLEWGYYLAFDLLNSGVSPGKRAFHLRAIHQDGRPINLGDSVLRNLLRAADLLPMFYAFGVLSMMIDHRFRRLGDLVAQTVVVHEKVSQLAKVQTRKVSASTNDLPERPRLTREERNALALFSRRLDKISHARAHELASILAPVFAERYGLSETDPVQLMIDLNERSQSL